MIGRETVTIGWDGRSKPIRVYRDELGLPDDQRTRLREGWTVVSTETEEVFSGPFATCDEAEAAMLEQFPVVPGSWKEVPAAIQRVDVEA